jgi:hypothetical protein
MYLFRTMVQPGNNDMALHVPFVWTVALVDSLEAGVGL